MKIENNKIIEVRKSLMKAKKDKNKELSMAYGTILERAILIAKNDGNRESNNNDLLEACKVEKKMNTQSKEAGAPYNKEIQSVCAKFLPKELSEGELRDIIDTIITNGANNIGLVMKELKEKHQGTYDGRLASTIIKESL